MHYVGSGTSGGLGVLDAAELDPTYAIGADRFVAHAGGLTALAAGVTDVEDDEPLAAADAATFGADDLVVGLAASGRTPYVGAALQAARAAGARTALVSCNPAAPLAAVADIHVCLDTGPEVVAGSTRMKAGTAQKLALHSLSTAVMIRLARPDLLKPHGEPGRHQREAARATDPHARRSHGPRRGQVRRGTRGRGRGGRRLRSSACWQRFRSTSAGLR